MQEVYVYAINVGAGNNILLGSKTLDIKAQAYTTTVITEKSSYDMFDVAVGNTDSGTVILALYNGNQLVDVQSEEYKGEALSFASFVNYDTVKIMLWDSIEMMMPLTQVEIK